MSVDASAADAAAELAASLPMTEIPLKLRCATCNLLAYNAMRTGCCQQNICESCFNELNDECLVCHQEPLDKSSFTPNRSMRMTVKVFLKKKLGDRASQLKRDTASKAEATQSSGENVEPVLKPSSDGKASGPSETDQRPSPKGVNGGTGVERTDVSSHAEVSSQRRESGQLNKPSDPYHETTQSYVEESSRGQQDTIAPAGGNVLTHNIPGQQDPSDGIDQTGQWQNGDMSQGETNQALGMGGPNGLFPADFNQMLPNAMNMSVPGFPGMMTAMNMDPMMNQMSQMLGGFGGPNVGLNGMNNMNMNMGFNGQGQFGGPWMAGQDNYNGNGNGNFGGQGGYNISSHQGNFNQMNNQHYPHHNDFQHGYGRHGFHNRGNRGRRGVYHGGGYMRNNYGHMHQGNQNGYANQGGFANQGHHLDRQSETDQGYAANLDEPVVSEISNEAAEAQMLKELNPGGDDDDQDHEAEPDTSKEIEVTEGQVTQEPHPGEQSKPSESQNPNEESQVIEVAAAEHMTEKEPETDVIESAPMPIQTFISDEPRSNRNMPPPGPNVPLGPAAQFQGRGLNRGFPANGHTVQSSSSVDPKGLGVAGAPTGPRALREGLPNTGASGRKGFAMHGRATTSAPSITSNTKERERGSDMRHEKEHGREHEAEREKTQAQNDRDETRSGSRSRPHSASRSQSRSPSQHRSTHQTSRRHRSASESSGSKHERREDRPHRRSRRHDEDEDLEDSTRRPGHRSHRYHEKDNDSSGHRRRRDRSREKVVERDHERDHNRDRDNGRDRAKDRPRERESNRDEERRRRRSKRSRSRSPGSASVVPTPTSARAVEDWGHGEDEGSRKRRTRERDEHDDGHHERKRSRRERSRSAERHNRYHGSSRETSKPSTPITPSFGHHSSTSSRRPSTVHAAVAAAAPAPKAMAISKPIPTGPRAALAKQRERGRDRPREAGAAEKDFHTLEREARNRERLLKEVQRRATMEGGSSSNNNINRRSVNVKYEDEGGAEARRIEREREGSRW